MQLCQQKILILIYIQLEEIDGKVKLPRGKGIWVYSSNETAIMIL